MVHGYHLILPHYGFWLPNDPRGSWSEFVASWEIARFGETTRHLEKRTLAMLSADELALRVEARQALHYPPVTLTGNQALSIANGFKDQAIKSSYAIWAPFFRSTRILLSLVIDTKRNKSRTCSRVLPHVN
jgi:hypothetical protein